MVEVIAIIISAVSLIFSTYTFLYTRKNSKLLVLKEYYTEDNTKEKINARRKIYRMSEEEMKDLNSDDTTRAWICSYYQFYANLYFNNVIDQETYRKIFGLATVKLYKKLEVYILARRNREGDNENYSSEFQKLAEDIERYHKY